MSEFSPTVAFLGETMSSMQDHINNLQQQLDDLRAMIRDRAAVALDNAAETRAIDPNCWGSGYDTGYSDALQFLLQEVEAAPPVEAKSEVVG